jgi:hypothetical protein
MDQVSGWLTHHHDLTTRSMAELGFCAVFRAFLRAAA